MKTMKLALVATVAVALTVGGWSATAAEKGSARGGASDLIRQVAPSTAPATAVKVMECPACKSEWIVRTDTTARGVAKPTYLTEKHLCGKCSTELKTAGIGKQAKNIPVHLCKDCTK